MVTIAATIMKENNYDRIAWCYDVLSFIVFGSSIKNSQIKMLPFIAEKSNILIAGGGTGWILEEIAKVHSSGLQITYIESSAEMIRRSKKRKIGFNNMEFINQSVTSVNLKEAFYDVVITSFFFDNFSAKNSEAIFKKFDKSLTQNGKWLFSDFQLKENGTLAHKAIVKIMYTFFKLTCRIEADKLPDTEKLFQSDYDLFWVNYLNNKLIVSKVFVKKENYI